MLSVFFFIIFFNKELWTMLLLCTNRALECLHVQPHILLSISYRIITHSKHDAWSELHALKVWTVPAVAVLELSHLAEKENSWTPIGWACKITVTLYSVRSSENLAFVYLRLRSGGPCNPAQIPIHRTNEMMRSLWLPRCEGDVSCVLHFLPCSAPSPPTRFMVWFILFWGVSLSTSIHRRHHFGKKNPSSFFSRKRPFQ